MERAEVSLHGEHRPLGETGDEITCQGSGEAEALRERRSGPRLPSTPRGRGGEQDWV